MLYLATASGPKVHEAMSAGLLGQMVTYKAPNRVVDGVQFAIDNGRVKLCAGQPVTDRFWDPDRWTAHLDRHCTTPGCLFAVVPDYICDADRTDELWRDWRHEVTRRAYRPAYVAQDGCRDIPADAQACFLGGSTEWKLGPEARVIAGLAKSRDLWLHMGRVNSGRRYRYAEEIGCDSVDGTFLAFAPHTNLPRLFAWMRR